MSGHSRCLAVLAVLLASASCDGTGPSVRTPDVPGGDTAPDADGPDETHVPADVAVDAPVDVPVVRDLAGEETVLDPGHDSAPDAGEDVEFDAGHDAAPDPGGNCRSDDDCRAQADAAGTCRTAACNRESGSCEPVLRPDGTPCDDGDPCTTETTCQAGACEGFPEDCDDGDECTIDSCDPKSGCQWDLVSGNCNGIDVCDGVGDGPGSLGCRPWFLDADGDGHGQPIASGCLCAGAPPFSAAVADDCNDSAASVHPGAAESCNGRDDDCDGRVDGPGSSDCAIWYADMDVDGWGDASLGRCLCGPEGYYVAQAAGDCEPFERSVHPGAPERCNGLDDDCDGWIDEGFSDGDGDGLKDCLDSDHDGDGVPDDRDDCPDRPDSLQEDTDEDGFGDACDFDDDDDGVADVLDNCPKTANPTQAETDKDGMGDACDPDLDDDGVENGADNCPAVVNADQEDCDRNGVGNACTDDDDGDTVGDATDNCRCAKNTNQADIDADGVGNACDAETCDGLDNDGDGSKDEGLPDDDSDKKCNEVDPCPLDPTNDADADGVCGPTDNCPYVANAGQQDDDRDGLGNSCDIDSVEACGEGAATNLPGAVSIPATLAIKDIVADPVRDLLYVVVGSADPAYPNSVVAIHAKTPSIAWSVHAGSDPTGLAISDDGKILYVALWGAAAVRLVDPARRRACHQFPVGMDSYYGALRAGDMDVVPGNPGTLVVSARRTGVSPDFAGVFVFDNGVVRRVHTADHTGARMITVASDTVAYGYNNSSTEYGFRKLVIDEDGVSEAWVYGDLIQGFSTDILFAGTRVYATTGQVVSPQLPSLVGTTGCTGRVAVAPASEEIFCAASSTSISVFSDQTFSATRNVAVTGLSGTLSKIVRWGAAGLALVSPSDIVVMDGVVGTR